jgi:hypothetical protein
LALARSKRATDSDAFGENASASGVFSPYKFSVPSLHISQTHHTSTLTNTNRSNIQLFHFFKMIPDLNYYAVDEENYTAEQSSGSSFLAGIFPTHNQTNSCQTYEQTNSYRTYNQINSYRTYDQTNFYPTYDQTNFYPTYDRTNSYLFPAIYSNNIICQQSNPTVSLYNYFGGSSSTTSDCNLADNIDRTEEQYNIDGRSSVDPTIIELSDDHDDQDEQDDGGPYYSSEEEM